MAKTLENIYLKKAASPALFTLHAEADQPQNGLKVATLVLIGCHAAL